MTKAIQQQEQDFYRLLFSQTNKINSIISKIIEFELCYHVFNEEPIREIDHSLDPPWDNSGVSFSTSKHLSKDMLITLRQLGNMCSGNTEATYCSGCGLYHKTYRDECQETAEKFLLDFCYMFILGCAKRKLFVDFLQKEIDQDIPKTGDWDEWEISNFACDLTVELMCNGVSNFFDHPYTETVWEQQVYNVCKKHDTIFRKYFEEKSSRDKLIQSIWDKYNDLAKSIIVPERFKQKICLTEECKNLRKELETAYSQEQLAILFGTRKLFGSNSYAGKYEILFREIAFKDVPHIHSVYEYLPEIHEAYQIEIITQAINEYIAAHPA